MFLRDWLKIQKLTIEEFAGSVGCTRSAASYWLSGKTRPSPRNTKTIDRITRGQVTADDLQRGWEMRQ